MLVAQDAHIHLGARSVYLAPLPGHTDNSIGAFVEGDKILFAGDAMLPVPHFVWGSSEDCAKSLRAIQLLKPESVVQGHGQLLLRGELAEVIEASLHYLQCVEDRVREHVDSGAPEASLLDIDIESCGISRVPLDGLVQYLHRENLRALRDGLLSGPDYDDGVAS
jgi:cyclase